MRDHKGNYAVSRYHRLTGALVVGHGSTIENARADLKNKLNKLREGLKQGLVLRPTGETKHSPGLARMEDVYGRIRIRHDPHREASVMARPDVVTYVQGGRKDNIVKETRQLRRARARG